MSIDLSDPLTISELTADREWWEIYDSSFPIAEREPAEVIYKSLAAGPGIALRVRWEGRTIGLAALHLLEKLPIAFCVYLAIAASAQGSGAGRRLFEHAATVAGRHLSRELVWEIEDPARAKSPAEASQRERRLRFFEKVGGRLLPDRYFQPPLHGDLPVPMRLMWLSSTATAPSNVPDLIRAIYFEKYGVINGINPGVLNALLEDCPASN